MQGRRGGLPGHHLRIGENRSKNAYNEVFPSEDCVALFMEQDSGLILLPKTRLLTSSSRILPF